LNYTGGYPYWRASKQALKEGYPVKSVSLSALKNRPDALVERCIRLQREMEEWLTGDRKPTLPFDGTFKGLFDLYETHEESTYRTLKGSSRQSYDSYLRLMRHEIGAVVIDTTDGVTLGRWFRAWSSNGKHLAKAHLCFKIIKAALVFGVTCRKSGCSQMLEIVREKVRTFPGLQPREAYITFPAVIELRKAAHQLGHPHAALAYALQFEANQRQRDIVGE